MKPSHVFCCVLIGGAAVAWFLGAGALAVVLIALAIFLVVVSLLGSAFRNRS